ncbi:hypothetical protein AXF42_Ash001889 [Apostasia shenzhenica]|uniref:DUF632 domain-containing protein n=1 Tax=Apostasia shenzhenica TaxID=1088818 RepID=A0A2I0ABH7_9ASPA|nr:hypothetical protein AXF42_Ash001889 [Apostasia shenzhenica]
MGCAVSTPDNEDAVKLCKDRKSFVKQAIQQSYRLAAAHETYIQSVKQVSASLLRYVDADDSHDFIFRSSQPPGEEGREEEEEEEEAVSRRPASMAMAMKDVDAQFKRICYCAEEVSVMLEGRRSLQCSSAPDEVQVEKLSDQVDLFRSASSTFSSSMSFQASSDPKEDGNDNSSSIAKNWWYISENHDSTLDKLYAWEKKLYEEVKAGEHVRIAYQKQCLHLRNHDINGEEPYLVNKTIAAIRDVHTKFEISIAKTKSISKRIEALRDAELCPWLVEFIHGQSRMWKSMARCHRIQNAIIEEAKLLLFTGSRAGASAAGGGPPAAASLAAELRRWRCCFARWIHAQRSFARALADWTSRCTLGDLCVRWSRLLDSMSEAKAVEGMKFFAAGMASVNAQHRKAAAAAAVAADMVAEEGTKVLCAGMTAAVGSLEELAAGAANGYDLLVRRYGRRARMAGR